MFLDQHHAEGAGHIEEQPCEPVIQIGVHEDLGVLRGNQAKRRYRGLGGGDVVIPVRQAKGEILAEIADRGRACIDGRLGVVQCAGQAQHEIPEMCRGGAGIGDACKVLRSAQDDARAAPRRVTLLGRVAH